MSIFGAAVRGRFRPQRQQQRARHHLRQHRQRQHRRLQGDHAPISRRWSPQSGSASDYSPGGVQTQPLYNIAQQGAIQAASSPTDLAISGGGFFVVNSNAAGVERHRRDLLHPRRQFHRRRQRQSRQCRRPLPPGPDADRGAEPRRSPPAAPATLSAHDHRLASDHQRQQHQRHGDADRERDARRQSAGQRQFGTAETMTVPVYDSLGVEHDMTLTFTPTGTANQWTCLGVLRQCRHQHGDDRGRRQIVQFNTDGTLDAAASTFNTANALSITLGSRGQRRHLAADLTFNLGCQRQHQRIEPARHRPSPSATSTRTACSSAASRASASARTASSPRNFSNGLTRAIAIVPLATFEDPDGLAPATPATPISRRQNSGMPLLEQPGTGAAGQIDAVLAREFDGRYRHGIQPPDHRAERLSGEFEGDHRRPTR